MSPLKTAAHLSIRPSSRARSEAASRRASAPCRGDGSSQSATFMDYLMPTSCDVPRIEIEHLETVPLDADVNFRGVGEGGMIVEPPTVVNAIEDALSPFGVRIYEQHLPPARILELIAAADPGQQGGLIAAR